MKLTLKQKRFADEYIISGNATEAAIKAGYSKKTAYSIAEENLKKPDIKSYIDERLAELDEATIATQKEVMQILTKHARRETVEYNVSKEGIIVQTPTSVANSIRAAELIGKRYALFTDKQELTQDINVNIAFEGVSRDESE